MSKRSLAGRIGTPCRLGLLLVLAPVAGCSQPEGRVSGQVLFGGKPLPGGYVMFLPGNPKHNSITATLDQNGAFSVVLPAGDVRVSVDNRDLEPRQPIHLSPAQLNLPAGVKQSVISKLGNPPPAPPAASGDGTGGRSGRYIKIPDKYYDAATSGLDFKVQGGEQKHNIELTN